MKEFFKNIFKATEKSYEAQIVNTNLNPWYSGTNAIYTNWVYVCIDKIAEVMSKTEFKLMKINAKGESEEVHHHSFLDMFYRPNEYQTLSDMIYMIVSWLELKGNAYILNDEKQMHVLNTDSVSAVYSDDRKKIIKYLYSTSKGQVTYKARNIVHIKYPNPLNPFDGKGTAEKVKGWIDIDLLSVSFTQYMFKNGSVLGGVIEADTNDKDKLIEIARSFKERYTGVSKSGETPVMPKGVKYKPLASSPKEMQVSESEERNVSRILKAFGVSHDVLGDVEGKGRANAEMSEYIFMSQTIEPKTQRLVEY